MRTNEEIQNEADKLLDLLLVDLFRSNNFELKTHSSDQKKEKGIDFYVHIFDRETKAQVLFFEIQSKGTQKPKFLKKTRDKDTGTISFPLDLRHIRQYYFELDQPIIVTLYDVESNTAYWYPIQLDETIPARVKEKEAEIERKTKKAKRPTLQIYFNEENVINKENFRQLYSDIQLSKEYQYAKHNKAFDTEVDYSVIEKAIEGKDILSKIVYTMELFQTLNVIPIHVLYKLFPFRGRGNNNYISNSTLSTTNGEFFDFMARIRIRDGRFVLAGEDTGDDISQKLKFVVDFLSLNMIRHIEWRGKDKKDDTRICVHKLNISKHCDCIRCSYERLNFPTVLSLLSDSGHTATGNGFAEKLKKGHLAFLCGEQEKAIALFIEVEKEAKKQEQFLTATIATYNLIQIRKRIRYDSDVPEEAKQQLEACNFHTLEGAIRVKSPLLLDVFKWIKDDLFFQKPFWNIDTKLDEILKTNHQDKFGNYNSNGYLDHMETIFIQAVHFLEFNYIIYEHYHEFKRMMRKVAECILASYTIRNENSSRCERVNGHFVALWVFHLDYATLTHLFDKYQIENLDIEHATFLQERIKTYFENIRKTLETFPNPDIEVRQKIEAVMENSIFILSRIKITAKNLNRYTSTLLSALEKMQDWNRLPYGALAHLLRCKTDISLPNLKRLIRFLKDGKHERSTAFSLAIKNYCEHGTGIQVAALMKNIFGSDYLGNAKLWEEEGMGYTGYALSFLDEKSRTVIRDNVLDMLRKKFDAELFNLGCIFDIVPFDQELMNKFKETVYDQNKKERIFGWGDEQHYRLSQFINVMYKFNIPFTQEARQLADRAYKKDYYAWLMDLDGFDYSKFNPYWVMLYQTKYYFEAFRKSKVLKKKLLKSLKTDYLEGVAKVYFKIS